MEFEDGWSSADIRQYLSKRTDVLKVDLVLCF